MGFRNATLGRIVASLLARGDINANSDFPTPAEVAVGDIYFITSDVTDDDPSKTNTGLSFSVGAEIIWKGATWEVLGSDADPVWSRTGAALYPTNIGDVVQVRAAGPNTIAEISAAGVFKTVSGGSFSFSSSANDVTVAADTTIGRASAGMVSITTGLTLGGDANLFRSSANVLSLGTGDTFAPESNGQYLGTQTERWYLNGLGGSFGFGASGHGAPSNGVVNVSVGFRVHGSGASNDIHVNINSVSGINLGSMLAINFGSVPNIGAPDVTLRRASANILQLASGDSFYPEDATSQNLGGQTNRWMLYGVGGSFGFGASGHGAPSSGWVDVANGVNVHTHSGSNDSAIYIASGISGIAVRPDYQFKFGSATATSAPDTGIARPTAGVLKVTNGTSGGGALRVGTADDATDVGDFVAGLVGASRLFYDQSTSILNMYNSSNVLSVVANAAQGRLEALARDFGDGAAGASLFAGRNTNGTNPGAGYLQLEANDGTDYYLWVDAAGKLRIHTSPPTTVNDTAGTIVGNQS